MIFLHFIDAPADAPAPKGSPFAGFPWNNPPTDYG